MFNLTFDGVVAASGGDFTTVQAADDYLDSGAYSLYVKQGSYAGFTVSTDNVRIEVEPGTTFTSGITLSGDNIELLLGSGCDVQGLLTQSGAATHVQCENGCDLDGILMSGNNGFFDGGGWDTLSYTPNTISAIQVTAADCIVQNVAAHADQATSSYSAVFTQGARTTFRTVKAIDSANVAFQFAVGSSDSLLEGCLNLDTKNWGVWFAAPRVRVIGCSIMGGDLDGVSGNGSGDDCVLFGNVIQVASTNMHGVDLVAGMGNNVVVGNRIMGYSGTGVAVNDTDGTSTVADNDTTA